MHTFRLTASLTLLLLFGSLAEPPAAPAQTWTAIAGAARDVGIGANGTVWIIGVSTVPGGHTIHRSTDRGANWTTIPGGAVRISVAPDGNAWVVNDANQVYRYDGRTFVTLPGRLADLAVGPDGSAFGVAPSGTVHRWQSSDWVAGNGGGTQIAAGPNLTIWVVNAAGQIWSGRYMPRMEIQATLVDDCPDNDALYRAHELWGCLGAPKGFGGDAQATTYTGDANDTVYECSCGEGSGCPNGQPDPPGTTTPFRRSVLVNSDVVQSWYRGTGWQCFVYGRPDPSATPTGFRLMTGTWNPIYQSCQNVMAETFLPTLPKQWCSTGCGPDAICDASESLAMTRDASACMSYLRLTTIPQTCSTEAQNATQTGQSCCFIFSRWHALAMGGSGLQRRGFSFPSNPGYISYEPLELLENTPLQSTMYDFITSVPNAEEILIGSQPGNCTPGNPPSVRHVLGWGGYALVCP